jgi:hypothetical protein
MGFDRGSHPTRDDVGVLSFRHEIYHLTYQSEVPMIARNLQGSIILCRLKLAIWSALATGRDSHVTIFGMVGQMADFMPKGEFTLEPFFCTRKRAG